MIEPGYSEFVIILIFMVMFAYFGTIGLGLLVALF